MKNLKTLGDNMISIKRMCTVGLLMIVLSGVVACAGDKIVENETSNIAAGQEKEDIIADISEDNLTENKETSQMTDSLDNNTSDAVGMEDRLLILPLEEDIPESIKKVFTEYSEFDMIFDSGSDIEFKENGNEVQLSVIYYSSEEHGEVGHLKTNVEKYDCDGPWYFEDSHCVLYWRAYKVMDFDNDGVNELVYIVSPDDSIPSSEDYYIIFHEIDGKAYAYASHLYDAKFTEDGIMTIGHGTIDYLYKITSFDVERFYIECLLYWYQSGDDVKFVSDGKYISYEEGMKYFEDCYYNKDKALFKSKDGLITL